MADIHQLNKTASEGDKQTPVSKQGPASKQHSQRRYSSDDVADIIRISLQNESGQTASTIDYEELVAIGKDVGVESDQIDHAVHMLAEERQARDKERSLWVKFKAHCIIFAIVSVFCLGINLLTGTEVFWVGYMIFGWGLFLLGHYAGLRFAPEVLQTAMERTKLITSINNKSYVEDDVNVSFTVADSSGLMESQGLVYSEDESLIIEYQNVDSILGLLKTGIKDASIKFDEIASAKVEQKLWGSELVLKGRSLKTFRHLPGSSSGVLHLKIARQSSGAALNLVDAIREKK